MSAFLGSEIRLGLIGAGRWGTNYISTITNLRSVKLAWIADPRPEIADIVGAVCPVFGDWQQAMSSDPSDGIIVATPPGLHSQIAFAAIDNGVPVLVEKPLTLEKPEADALLAKARSRAVHVAVGHIHLFSPAYERLKELARSMGKIRRITSQGGRWGPFRDDVRALWDWGPHDLALAIDLVGEVPHSVSCVEIDCQRTCEGLGEVIRIELAFPCHATAEIEVGNLFRSKKRWLRADFDDAHLLLDDTQDQKLFLGRNSAAASETRTPISTADTLPLTNAVRSFAGAIRASSKDLSQLELGVQVVGILADCDRQLRL
ncbi:MAG: Gfo/Idh/MocA family oxidoreductase [Rhodospirillales bacterium]|nr:Gfo/Idh/MocA family oxidoreductase [Rhodospirillales bacterium]